jgi:hypothetical protein
VDALHSIFGRSHAPTDSQAGAETEPGKRPKTSPTEPNEHASAASADLLGPQGRASVQTRCIKTREELKEFLEPGRTICRATAPTSSPPVRLEGRLFAAVPWPATGSVSLVSSFSESIRASQKAAETAVRRRRRKRRSYPRMDVCFA